MSFFYHRRKRQKKFTPLSDVLIKSLRRSGRTDFARQLEITLVWSEAVGAEIARRTEPISFSRGVLTVKARSPSWQNELTFLKSDILHRLNRELGQASVRGLKVISGPYRVPSEAREPKPAHDHREPDPRIEKTAQLIHDPELRAQFVRMMVGDRSHRAT